MQVRSCFKQLLDEIFVISRIIKVEVGLSAEAEPSASTDNLLRP